MLDRGLDSPGGMLLGGNELFVSNGYGGYANDGSVTELDLLTGRVVKTISGLLTSLASIRPCPGRQRHLRYQPPVCRLPTGVSD